MSNTFKIERARALHGKPDKKTKKVKLIPTGRLFTYYDNRKPPETSISHVAMVDTGGVRYGNQRKMRSKLKVDLRKAERKKLNREFDK